MLGVQVIICLILGATFLISSLPKLSQPRKFVLTVLEYRVLPSELDWLYGWLLPPVEFLLAIFLITGTAVCIAANITALLLISFMLAVGINMARGRDLACHCFGTKSQRTIGWPLLLQDGLLLGAAAIVAGTVTISSGVESWSVFHIFPGAFDKKSFVPLLIDVVLAMSITLWFWVKSIRKKQSTLFRSRQRFGHADN